MQIHAYILISSHILPKTNWSEIQLARVNDPMRHEGPCPALFTQVCGKVKSCVTVVIAIRMYHDVIGSRGASTRFVLMYM